MWMTRQVIVGTRRTEGAAPAANVSFHHAGQLESTC